MPESLADIARVLNVATSTVSRALTAPDKVAPKTREKILNYIKQTDYRPNISARNLRTQRSITIGIVVNDLCDSIIATAANIMQDEANQRGYFPVVLTTGESRSKEKELIDSLLMSNVCGLVIIPSSGTASLLDQLKGIPVVELDRSTDTNLNDEFRMDDKAAMQMATQNLIDQGCKNIAVIFGNIKRISSFKSRYLALSQCSNEANYTPFFLNHVHATGLTSGAKALISVFAKANKLKYKTLPDNQDPFASLKQQQDLFLQDQNLEQVITNMAPIDGILAVNNSIASGVLQGSYAHNLKINEDFKFFTFDNPKWLSVLPYKINTISHPLDKAAKFAINRLIDRIEKKYTEAPEVRLIRPKLIEP